jgi:sulfatase maturation enzyme AslB (radical SAM superfamily)
MSDKIKGDAVKVVNGHFQSEYQNSAEHVLTELNQVSPSFCLAKWYNVSIHIPTGQTHSCYHPRSHHIPLEEIAIDVSALHNTKHKKVQRELMLKGERPSECEFCWQIEDSGNNLSDRAYRSKDVYTPNLINEAKQELNPNPRYVEVNFNQACNFTCSYCSPHLSTAWMKDIEKNGPYALTKQKHNDIRWMATPNNSLDNPYLLAFWEWLPQIYPTLHTFRMTGGEPLMDKNTFRMFDYVKSNPKKDLHLSITSNCCPPGDQWAKFMTSFKELTDADAIEHFMLYCSLDSWGEQSEYIRNGMDFTVLYKNVKEYLSQGNKHSLTFIATFNALSYTGWNEYIKQIHLLRQEHCRDRQLIWFDVPMLSYPEWLNPKLIPELVVELEKSVNYMEANKETKFNRFHGFKDFEISKVQRLIDWVNSPSKYDRTTAMRDFYLYFAEYDRRHNKDFCTVFPTLEYFWKECKALHGS